MWYRDHRVCPRHHRSDAPTVPKESKMETGNTHITYILLNHHRLLAGQDRQSPCRRRLRTGVESSARVLGVTATVAKPRRAGAPQNASTPSRRTSSTLMRRSAQSQRGCPEPVRSLDQYRWLGAQVGERMDLIRRGEHQSGTCLSRGCRNAVRWK